MPNKAIPIGTSSVQGNATLSSRQRHLAWDEQQVLGEMNAHCSQQQAVFRYMSGSSSPIHMIPQSPISNGTSSVQGNAFLPSMHRNSPLAWQQVSGLSNPQW